MTHNRSSECVDLLKRSLLFLAIVGVVLGLVILAASTHRNTPPIPFVAPHGPH